MPNETQGLPFDCSPVTLWAAQPPSKPLGFICHHQQTSSHLLLPSSGPLWFLSSFKGFFTQRFATQQHKHHCHPRMLSCLNSPAWGNSLLSFMLKNMEEKKKSQFHCWRILKRKIGPYVFLKWMALALTKLFLFSFKTVLNIKGWFC